MMLNRKHEGDWNISKDVSNDHKQIRCSYVEEIIRLFTKENQAICCLQDTYLKQNEKQSYVLFARYISKTKWK